MHDPTRIDLLFTMSEITQVDALVRARRLRNDVFADDVVTGDPIGKAAGLPSRSSRQPVRLRPLGSGVTALLASRAKAGGARRDRTDDLMLAKHALSQLSYGPVTRRRMRSWHAEPKLAATSPPTPVGFRRGSLALAPASEGWWAWEDLNFRPHAYQARALTN